MKEFKVTVHQSMWRPVEYKIVAEYWNMVNGLFIFYDGSKEIACFPSLITVIQIIK